MLQKLLVGTGMGSKLVQEERLPISSCNSYAVKILEVAKYPPESDEKSGYLIVGHIDSIIWSSSYNC